MTAREREVVRSVIRALRGITADMDAVATSYDVPPQYALATPKGRAAMLLEALVRSDG